MQMSEPSNNVVLIGMPGAGKSTVGVVLAKILNKHFVDTDLLIQKRHDETLQKMIDAYGSEGFIERENALLRELEADDSVVSTGGSAVYSDEGMTHLKEIGHVVYLRGSVDEIASRIEDFDERGIVIRQNTGRGLAGLLEERGPLYERYADATVDIDGKSVTETARSIVECLEAR